GIVRKTAGTDYASLSNAVEFHNTGSVEVQAGTLHIGSGSTSGAVTFTISENASLRVIGNSSSAPFIFTNGSVITVLGSGTFSTGHVRAAGDVWINGDLHNVSGTLTVDDQLIINGHLHHTG